MNNTISLNEYLSNDVVKPSRIAYLMTVTSRDMRPLDGVTTIGRAYDNSICLSDAHVSLHHCRIEKRPFGYFIRDLKSRNGVKVNSVSVTEAQLTDGNHIQIGKTEFIFQIPTGIKDDPIASKNPNWALKLQSIHTLAQNPLPIFLQGESGTGKEVLAQKIHGLRKDSQGEFVSVNCSSLTETLVESELFGHTKGAFTGATSDRKGAFETARGGTLFLDEIGDLPPNLQPKLLRALENCEIRAVGSDKTIKTNVKIICATHKNLETLVAEGNFRADLYFRINVIKIQIPALRERLEDFDDLLNLFSKEWRTRFSPDAIYLLKRHSWPGNIRELKNVIARASAIYPGQTISGEQVVGLIDKPVSNQPREEEIRMAERELIQRYLVLNKGNQRRTARELGIAKSTLHDKIRNYQIDMISIANLNRLKVQPCDTPVIEDVIYR